MDDEMLETIEEKVREGVEDVLGDKMDDLADLCIKVPSDCTPRIQESHILIGHIICAIVEENLFGQK